MILYLTNNDYIVKIEDFNGSSMTGMEYAQTSDPSTWYTFTSVALETPSAMDVNNGYGWATHKFVGFGENGTGNNMIFFSDAFGPGTGNSIGSSISFHGLALSGDWGSLYYDTTKTTAEVAINLLGVGLANNYIMDTDMGDSVSFHNGTYNGASFSSDAGRNHISFDGVDDFATITDTANLAGDQWTISMWLKTSVTSGRQDFFSQWYDPTHYPSIGLATNDGVLTAYYRGHNTGAIGQLTGSNIANGEWRHISYVKDGTAVKLYIDGSLVASSAFSGPIDSTSDIFLGAWDGSVLGYAKDHYFTGGMDNLMIHTRGLTASEVSELHTSTIVTVPATVTVDQDPSSVSIGDVMTATVDLQGGTLGYFAWEKYNAESSSWAVVAGGSNSVVDMTVAESMSEATMKVSMQVDGQWYFSADMTMPVLDINDGLVAKYALDTNAGDSIGTNNLSLMGGTVSYGAQDGHSAAAGFSSGELRSDATIDLTGEFTVSFWAKEGTPYTYSGNNYSSFFRWGTHEGSYFDLYLLNGKIRALHSAGSGWVDNRGSVAVPAGWNHYAMTIDPSSGSKIVYLNGVAQTLSGGAFSGTFAASQQVWLGNISTQSGFRLNGGKMDDTRIWNRALSAAEIAGLHAAGAEEPPATPEMKFGYSPLYLAESDANGHAGGDGSSHSHVLDGVTYYMPNGLVMGVTQHHGTYGIEARYLIDNNMDDSVNSNDGTANGSVDFPYHSSRDAMAILSDAAIATIPDTLNIGSGPYTINVWVHPENFDQTGTMITDHVTGSIYPSFHMVYAQTTGKIVVYHRSANSSPYQMFTSTGGLTLNQWQLVTVTWDGSTIKVYFDGVLDSQGSITNTTWTSTVDYRVGSDTYAGIYVRGMMDDLTIHNREMPASEVTYWHAQTTVEHVGIMSRYTFDTGTAFDSVGNADGTASGVTFETLESRTAATFVGSGGIDIPHAADQGFDGTATTVSAWFKTTQTDQGYAVLKGYGGGNNEMWLIAVNEDGGPANKAMFYWRNRAQEVIKLHSMTDVNDGAWHHIVTVRDGGNLSLYVDGALEAFSTGATGTFDPTQAMRLGKWDHDSHSAGTFYVGSMDDVIIYNEALNASAVADLYTNTTVVHTPSNDVSLTVFTADSYGDTWNGNVLNILDANGTVVATSNGPASGVKAPAGLTESISVPNNADYTWTLGGGSYMNEVRFSFTDPDGTVLVNVTNGQTTSAGSFTVGTPVADPTISGVVDSFVSDEITLSVSMNAYGESVAAGWSYRLDDNYVMGQTHGGTAVAMGQTAAISVPPGETTIYIASLDSNANVLAVNSITQSTVMVTIEINKSDSYGDGWNGAAFTMTSNGNIVVNETLTSGGKPGPVTVNVQVAVGTYDYALSAGSYPGELFMTVVNTDSSEILIDIPQGTAPASGQVTITPPQPSVTLGVSSGFEAIYVSATPNQQALDDGATQWALLGSDIFGDVGTTIDPAIPLSDLANLAYIFTTTEDALTGYAAIVDSSGVILAKSSVSGQAMINQLPSDQEMVLMAVLAPMFLDDQNILAEAGTIPSTLSDGNNLAPSWQFGPFYLGDLQVSSYGTITTDFADDYGTDGGLLIPTVFNDGMGNTGSADLIGKMVKDLIRKLDLHQLDGDLSPFAVIFQSVLDGSDKDAIKLIDPEETSLMMKLGEGGYAESYQYKFCQQVGELGLGEGIRNMTIPDQVLLLDKRGGSWNDSVDPGAIKGVIAPAESVISGEASVSSGEVTMSVSVGEFAQAQGAVGWVYALDQSVGDLGQTTSETVNSLGSDAVFTPSPAGYTAYVAAVNASGIIMATDSFGFDARPMRKVRFEVITSNWRGTTYGGASLTFTDPESGQSWTSPAVAYSTNSAVASFPVFEIPESVYSWSCVGNATTSDSVHIRLVEVDENENVVRPLVYVWNRSQPLRLQNYVSGLDYQSGWGNSTVYTLHNSSPNVTSGQFVLPEDTIAPVMTLIGESPLQVYTGAAFVDPGVSVNDNLDPVPVVTVTGHESLAISEPWTATTPYNGAPVINGDLLNFDQPAHFDHTVHKETNISSSEESWEVVVEFDNYSAYNNHSYNWLAFFIPRTTGGGYLQLTLGNLDGLGVRAGWHDGTNGRDLVAAQIGLISSGALKIARENGNFKFYYSLDKVSFTLITQVPDTITTVNGGGFGTEDLQIQLRVKDAAADVTSFRRTDIPYGAQQGEYTLTYSAEDFSGNTETLQRTVSVVPETYEWHHNNQLTGIVKYLHGYDADGERSHMYLKDDDGLTVLYFTPDLETFASFTSYDVDQHFIEGAPVCAAYGPAGKVLLGTSTGCVYLIQIGTLSVPQSFTKVHDNGGMRINQVHFGATSNAWLIEYNEEVHTMPAEGGVLTMRMTIPAGSHVIDFAQADDATSIIIRKADYSFATYIAMPGWATIHDESAMRAIFSSLGVTNVDYDYALDKWTAADDDYNVIATDQIIDWLLS